MKRIFTLLFLFLATSLSVYAQSAADYSFSTTTGTALDPMVGAVTICGSGIDDAGQPSVAIGFPFNFVGATYNDFAVTPDGFAQLGNGAFTATNDFSNSILFPNGTDIAWLFPWWDDMHTGTDGSVTTTLIGTSPNQIRVVNWFVTMPRNINGVATVNFQLWLYETTNVVEFRYGDVTPLGSTASASVGIMEEIGTLTYNSVSVATHTNSTTSADNGNSGYDTNLSGTGRSYVFTPPSCPAPGGLTAFNQLTTSASLAWNSTAAGVLNQIELDLTGFTLGAGGITGATASDTIAISGLTAATTYDFYVRTVCGPGDTSNWSGPFTFNTPCNPYVAPYTESFDLATIDVCASQSAVQGGPWVLNGGFSWNTACGPAPAEHTGNGGRYIANDMSTNGGNDAGVVFQLNDVDVSALTTPYVDFYHYMCGPTQTPNEVYVEAWNGTSWALLGLINTGTAAWENYGFTLAGNTFAANLVRVRFRIEQGSPGNFFDADIALDDISILEAPTCFIPTATASTDIRYDSVAVSWTTGGAASWIIEYGTTGFTQGTGTISVANGTASDTLIGLTAETAYDWYVRDYCGPGDSSLWVGPMSFTTLPTCPAPTGLSVYGVTDIDASFTWTTGGSSNFIVEIGTPGFTPGAGTSVQAILASNDTASTSSLVSLTQYEVYVRDYCGPGDSSVWIGPVSFTTEISPLACPPGTGAPFTLFETSFEDAGCTGSSNWNNFLGFTNVATGTAGAWRLECSGSTGSGWIDAGAFDGNDYAYFETTSATGTNTSDTLTTPTIDISSFSGAGRATGYYLNGGNSTFIVDRSLDGGATWTNVLTNVGPGGTATNDLGPWTLFADDFSAALGTATTITWRFVGVSSGSTNQGDIGLDLLSIEVCASCIPPSNVVAAATASDSALITFTPYGGASNVMLEYGPAPLTPGTGTMLSSSNDSIILSGLMAATDYEVLISSDCSASTGDSSTVDSYLFTTPCAVFTAPYLQDFDAGLSTPICWSQNVGGEQWLYQVSGGGGPDYGVAGSVDHTSGSGNFTWIDASGGLNANELISADIDISALSFPVAGFWILSNNTDNGAQNSIELYYWDGAAWALLTTYAGNNPNWVEVSDTLPPTAPSVTRFRLVQVESTTGTGNAFNNDLLVDDFFVIEAPTCPGVSNLAVSAVATDTAVLSWTETGGATQWLVDVVPTGSAPGVGTLVSTNPYTVTGLNSNTSYTYYVQSYCGPADSSAVFSGGSFTTQPVCGDTVGGLIYSLTNTAEVLFSFQGDPGDFVSLEFLAGQVETCCDEVLVYDGLNGTGNILYGSLTGGGLADYSGEGVIESQTGSISLVINSDVSVTAASANFTPFEVVIDCYPPPVAEIGVTSILSPVSACGQAATPIQIVVENFGFGDIFYAPVVVELSGDITAVYSLVIDSLPIGAVDTIDLNVLNTLAGGSVTFTAFTNLANDQDTSNDTTQVTLEFGAIPATPSIANVEVCEGDSATLGFASLGALSWFETDTSSSPFFVGDTLSIAGADTSFYISQQGAGSGTFTIDLFDTFGDGWNGHSLVVSINGVPVAGSPFTLNNPPGDFSQETFTAGNGDTLTLEMLTGGFANEVSYSVTDPSGNVVFQDGVNFGPQISLGLVFDNELQVLGCPSDLAMVQVNVNPTYLDTVVMSACDSMLLVGAVQTVSGFYTDSLTSVSGCDSIVVYDLTINNSYDESVGVTICDAGSYTLPDGSIVSDAGLYTTVLTATNGCDSTIETQLTVVSTFSVSQNIQLCAGDTLFVGTSAYDSTGTYVDSLLSIDGCDSVVTSNLVVFNAIDVSIAGVTVVCENEGVVDLTLNPIGGTLSGPGVTGNSFDPAAAGLGTSTLTYTFSDANGCDAMASLDVEVVVCTGIENIEGIETVSIFPNPYVSTINVRFEDAIADELTLKLLDITGRTIVVESVQTSVGLNTITLEVSPEVAAGVTILQIERDGAVYSKSLIKK